MFFDQTPQYYPLLFSFILGVTFGILWEIFRLWRRISPSPVMQFFRDFIFAMLFVLGSRTFYSRISHGQIRWFYILAQLMGMVLYHWLIGRFLYEPIYHMMQALYGGMKWCGTILFYPVKVLFGLLGKVWNVIQNWATLFLKKLFIFVKRYIIIFLYKSFYKKPKLKERTAHHGEKGKKESQGDISRFYH